MFLWVSVPVFQVWSCACRLSAFYCAPPVSLSSLWSPIRLPEDSNQIMPEPSLLQSEEVLVPQPVLTREVLQPLSIPPQCPSPKLTSVCQCPSFNRVPNWTQYSRFSLTSAKQRGTMTSFKLVAALLFMQPRILMAFCWWPGHTARSCWIYCPARPSAHFLPRCSATSQSLTFTDAWLLFCPMSLHFSLFTFSFVQLIVVTIFAKWFMIQLYLQTTELLLYDNFCFSV